MSDQPQPSDHVVFTIGGKEFPVPLISFARAKEHGLIGPPELIEHIEKRFALVAALLHSEEKPMSPAFLMEAALVGEALNLEGAWSELMQKSGMPRPASAPDRAPQAPPLPEMPSLSIAVLEQTAGRGPNFPDVNPPAAG